MSILDASFVEKGKIAHMGLEDIKAILEKYNDKKIIPTHMHDDTIEEAKNISIENFILLKDGEEFEF